MEIDILYTVYNVLNVIRELNIKIKEKLDGIGMES